MEQFSVGKKIWFTEDPLPYEIKALNDRYVVCTRKLNKRKDADLLWFEVERGASLSFTEAYQACKNDPVYTIIDKVEKIRGTENLIFGMGFHTTKLCKAAIVRLTNKKSEISHRCRIELNIKAVA